MRRFFRKFFTRNSRFYITKREKLAAGVIFLSVSLFIVEYFLGKSGIIFAFVLSFFSDLFLYWAIKEDLEDNFTPHVFFLPFLFTLAFALFYLLVPSRILTRIITTILYGFGVYSLFLSQNIFTVSSIRTIALLSGARTVSLMISLLTYFFLTNVVFSLHLNIIFTLILVALYSFPLVAQSIWTYTLDKNIYNSMPWGALLTLALGEVALLLWFWPSTPTIIALFMTGFLYIVLGLSHLWLERRLFRGVILEYLWVAVVVFTVLVVFTSWS